MGQTTHQIENHIEKTRDDLGANLHELERKVKDMTDWKYHFRNHPMTLMGAAFGGGILLATMISGPRTNSNVVRPQGLMSPPKQKATETWDLIKDALVGVAATRLTDFVGELVPGFKQEFQSRTKRDQTTAPSAFLT